MDLNQALSLFETELNHLSIVCNLPHVDSSFAALRDFYITFSYLVPDIIARSRMQSSFYAGQKILGRISVTDFVTDMMKQLGIPSNFFENDENVKQFVERMSKVIPQYFRVLVNNRARVRRRFCHLLEDLAVLHAEAEELDASLAQPSFQNGPVYSQYFTLIIVEQQLSLMVMWLQLGFELDLYNLDEYDAVYWYLDYLYALHLQNQNSVLALVALKSESEKLESAKTKKDKKNKKATKKNPPPTQHISLAVPHFLLVSHHFLSKGLFKFISALEKHGHVSKGSYLFGNAELRFMRRVAPFLRLPSPPSLLYPHYMEAVQMESSRATVEQILTSAIDAFQSSKMYLEKALHYPASPAPSVVQEIKALLRIVISNTLNSQLLLKIPIPSEEDLIKPIPKAKIDFSVHHYYPIISVPKK